MRNLLWFLLAIGLIALLFVYLEQSNLGVGDLGGINLPVSGTAIMIAAGIGVLAIVLFGGQFRQALKSIAIWIAIALALAVGYTYRFELREVADRVIAEFVPGHAATRGSIVEIARGQGGSFVVHTQINGAHVAMIFDTGASSVVLTLEAAKAAGLPLEVLNYSVNIDTANGRARAAPVTLKSVSVGGIVEKDVPALIAQRGQLRVNLLGMSFLDRLQGWEVRGDRLVLRAYP